MKIIKEHFIKNVGEWEFYNTPEHTFPSAKDYQELLSDLPENINLEHCEIMFDEREVAKEIPPHKATRNHIDRRWWDIYLVLLSDIVYKCNECGTEWDNEYDAVITCCKDYKGYQDA